MTAVSLMCGSKFWQDVTMPACGQHYNGLYVSVSEAPGQYLPGREHSRGRGCLAGRDRLDLADQVQRRSQSFGAFFPLGGADFVRVVTHVLSRFYFAHQFFSVTTDVAGVQLDDLDLAVGVDNESTAISQTRLFDQHFEVARDLQGRVSQHRELQLADSLGTVVPCLVGEVGVGGHTVNFDAHLLEFFVLVLQVAQLGGADKGEVGRIEEENVPLAFQVGVGNVDELTVVVSGSFERLDFGIQQRHAVKLQKMDE